MALKRKPFQGVLNIIRFNQHFYIISGAVIVLIMLLNGHLPKLIQPFTFGIAALGLFVITTSLLISFYIYDLSNLYQLPWFSDRGKKQLLTVNAGFDETSSILQHKSPESTVTVCDFYNPEKHTELSLTRARKAYPPAHTTRRVSTTQLPFPDHTFDYAFTILAAHEIRDRTERLVFFKELARVTKPTGHIFVTEHLRDLNNFMAYTLGAFHFYTKANWQHLFKQAELSITQQIKTTPFITTFVLKKHGATS